MTTVQKQAELFDKTLAGLEKLYEKLIELKKAEK